MFGIFDLELLINLVFCEYVEARFFLISQITQVLNKIKEIPEHPFVDIGKQKTCTKFQQKLLNFMVVEVCQSFQFFRQNTWFLENDTALSKFCYGILHNVISITKL